MFPWFYSQKVLRFLYLNVFPYHLYLHTSPILTALTPSIVNLLVSSYPSFSPFFFLFFTFNLSATLFLSFSLCLSFYFFLLPSLIISLSLFPFNKCWAPKHLCEVGNTLTTKTYTFSILGEGGLLASCLSPETDSENCCKCGEI